MKTSAYALIAKLSRFLLFQKTYRQFSLSFRLAEIYFLFLRLSKYQYLSNKYCFALSISLCFFSILLIKKVCLLYILSILSHISVLFPLVLLCSSPILPPNRLLCNQYRKTIAFLSSETTFHDNRYLKRPSKLCYTKKKKTLLTFYRRNQPFTSPVTHKISFKYRFCKKTNSFCSSTP